MIISTMIASIITRLLTLIHQNVQRKVKRSEHSKVSNSKTWQRKNIKFCNTHKHHASKLFINAQKLLQFTISHPVNQKYKPFGTKYSITDQVKIVECSFLKFALQIFKGCLKQISLGPFFNNSSHLIRLNILSRHSHPFFQMFRQFFLKFLL